jgi:uncharacterized protein
LPPDLLDRDPEAERLLERALGAHNSRVAAPRRYGKTSLLHRVLRDASDEGLATVYVNLFGVISIDDLVGRIDRAYTAALGGPLAAWWSGLRRTLRPSLTLGGGPIPASVSATATSHVTGSLAERLALPVKLLEQRGLRTLVALDEFQDVLAADTQLDAIIRAEIEGHGDAASYIFAGSQVGMMAELFSSKRRAFYAQAGPVELEPLAATDVAAYVEERFRLTDRDVGDALDPLLELTRGHPQRTMLMAHALWDTLDAGSRATQEHFTRALDRVLDVEIRDELRAIWTSMTTSERRVLVAVADNRAALYSRAVTLSTGSARGGSMASAASKLRDAGELVGAQTPTGYELVDPLLAAWVRAGRQET